MGEKEREEKRDREGGKERESEREREERRERERCGGGETAFEAFSPPQCRNRGGTFISK